MCANGLRLLTNDSIVVGERCKRTKLWNTRQLAVDTMKLRVLLYGAHDLFYKSISHSVCLMHADCSDRRTKKAGVAETDLYDG
jgi:hypothetical protein